MQRDLIYLAGFFDGEGCVVFRWRMSGHWVTALQLTNSDTRPLELAKELFGGKIYCNRKKPNPVYQWMVSGTNSEKFAKAIVPYCVVKREQLQFYLIGRKTFNGPRATAHTEATHEKRNWCAEEIVRYRKPRGKRGDDAYGRIAEPEAA